MDSTAFISDEYTEICEYINEESHYKSITEYNIGMVDFSLLLMMWLLAFVTSVRSFGRGPGVLFLVLNIFLVLRKASNGILVLLLLFYAPILTLYIPRIFVCCSAIALFGYCIHGYFANINAIFNRYLIYVGIFVIFSGMLIFISPHYATAIDYYMRYFEGFLAVILLFGLIKNREDLGRMLKWWVIVGALSLIICIAHYIIGNNTPLFDLVTATIREDAKVTFTYVGGWKYNRLLWPGAEANYFAAYLIIAFGISIAFYSSVRRYSKKFFWGIIGCFIVINIIGTFSRSGFLSTVFVLGLLLIRKNIRAIIPVGIIIGLGFMMLQFLPGIQERILGIRSVAEQGASGRFVLWGLALAMFSRSPIWGNGIGAFVVSHHDATHNTYLQILAEGGLIGIFLYCFILFMALKYCYSIKYYYLDVKHPDIQFSQVMIIAVLGLCMMIATIAFQDVKLLWMVCGACYLLYQLTKKELGY